MNTGRVDEALPFLLGTYVYPLRFLSEPDFGNSGSAHEIIDTVRARDFDVYVTCIGGLFLEVPPNLIEPKPSAEGYRLWDHFLEQKAFEQRTCRAFNLLLCELCLHGAISQPASPAMLGTCHLRDNTAQIESMPGGQITYFDRALGPAFSLRDRDWFLVPSLNKDYDALRQSRELTLSNRLSEVADSLPALVAGSYSLYSQRQTNEALIDAWIACEQILDSLWVDHVASLQSSERRARLEDSRSYSAAIRLEILHTAGRLPGELYEQLTRARQSRNALAHRAENTIDATTQAVEALGSFLKYFLKAEVSEFKTSQGELW